MDESRKNESIFHPASILHISCHLGDDTLLPQEVKISEAVNSLFEIELVAYSDQDINPADLIGKPITLKLKASDAEDGEAESYRSFNALVTSMWSSLVGLRNFRSHHLKLRPQLWLLTQRINHRIWKDKTATDMLQDLLSEHGLPLADLSGVIGSLPIKHYSVQHGESDYSYCLRRLSEVGLFWWFTHEDGGHTMHVADHPSGWLRPSKLEENRVLVRDGAAAGTHIHNWQRVFTYIPGSWTGRDWNFETPKATIQATSSVMSPVQNNAQSEIFEYPCCSTTIEEAERIGKLRMQAIEASYDQAYGQSDVRTLVLGRCFQPYTTSENTDYGGEYVITSIDHEIMMTRGVNDAKCITYTNKFVAIPSRIPLTPLQNIPAPKIYGTEIAVVAGPQGEEIYTDQFGRVQVYFPWDRRAKKDGTDGCWLRVSQSWNGNGSGAQNIPRIGTEVIVAFIDGDPDRPVIVGVVSNSDHMPSYELPVNKTLMVLRSHTHKGTGFNEISFEDAAGKENQFFHAQKDRTERVLGTSTKRIDGDFISSVGANYAFEIGGSQKQEVGGAYNLTIGGVGAKAQKLADDKAVLSRQSAKLISEANSLAGEGLVGEQCSASLVKGALGFFDGDGLQAREGVVSTSNPGKDAGAALASSGNQIGKAVERMFSQNGAMNTVVGTCKTDMIGSASIEQVGQSKVTNIGAVFIENVGKIKKIIVGEELIFEVGSAKLTMTSNGDVKITGKSLDLEFSGSIKLSGKTIHLN